MELVELLLGAQPCLRGAARLLRGRPAKVELAHEEEASDMDEHGSPLAFRKRGKGSLDIHNLPTTDTLPELPSVRDVSGSGESEGGSSKDPLEDPLQRAEAKAREVAVAAWDPEAFQMVRTLQDAPRNQGRVDLMQSLAAGGGFVAVKLMPTSWVTSGPQEFADTYPDSIERPWNDIGIVRLLHEQGYPFVCEPRGVFRDHEMTYVVSALAEEGDLFGWLQRGPRPGTDREAMLRPIMQQLFTAVKRLHSLGIAHRDLSLENVLLTEEAGELSVRLVDFAAATGSRCCVEASGKPSYMAPEMLEDAPYDPFAADVFATGVSLFSLAACAYPWNSTKPGACKLFGFVAANGLRAYMQRRKVCNGDNRRLAEVLTPELQELLCGLLDPQPAFRLQLLPRACARPSALQSAWLQA